MSKLRQSRVRANGLDFACLEAGSEGAPLALCLHGFPDTAHTWRHLLPSLASVGYRAVAPFLRGYAPTAIPADGRYQSAILSRDAIALIEALGATRATVIGHDWGAVAAHGAAILAPERVRKLVTLSVPHRTAGVAIATSYDQQRRSWYMFFFQSPFADAAVAANDYAFLERLWQDWSPGWKPEPEDVDALKRCFREPGVLQAALGYYRAFYDPAKQDPALAADQMRAMSAEVPVETLYLHGADDGCIGVGATRGMEAGYAAGVRKVIVEGAGHFLHLERPRVVNDAIRDFLGAAMP
ncbi:MAG TPA: alpha/beta hydrolase [Myxococcota bacterium]|jgi:pimeloyl-ACP methyl ester carboxylesterase|nr:alpha/beta hydrolase [Myxococcota bacterium]